MEKYWVVLTTPITYCKPKLLHKPIHLIAESALKQSPGLVKVDSLRNCVIGEHIASIILSYIHPRIPASAKRLNFGHDTPDKQRS